jgi:hypothetical protein
MAKPNSITTVIRQFLADRIMPMPKPGLSWCVNCRFNGGMTWEMLDRVIADHVKTHGPGETVHIVSLSLTSLDDAPRVTMTERDQGDEIL